MRRQIARLNTLITIQEKAAAKQAFMSEKKA
jgi:ribosomal protein L29